MIKSIATLFLLLPLFSFAQTETREAHLIDDTLITKTGYKVYEDMKLKMGTGSLPNGDFKFIRRSATSLFQYTGADRGTVNNANAFPGQQGKRI